MLSDDTTTGGTGGTTPNPGLGRNDDLDFAEEFDDDDSVIAARRQRERSSPSAAVAPVQAGDKQKLRKLLGDDALYFLNAGAGTGAGGNGVNIPKGANESSSSLPTTSAAKTSAGSFARRRRENKRRSQESDTSVNANGRPGSSSSLPGSSVGSSSIPASLNSVPTLSSGGPVSHLDLSPSTEGVDIGIQIEQDTDSELDGAIDGHTQGESITPLTPRIPRTPRTPRTPHANPGTPRTASGLPPGVSGVSGGGKSDKVRRLLGDDDAQAFHNAKQALASQPWYLKPERDDDGGEVKLEHDGSVKYGSVEALVERLTVPFFSKFLYYLNDCY